jgi:hypothetical protein
MKPNVNIIFFYYSSGCMLTGAGPGFPNGLPCPLTRVFYPNGLKYALRQGVFEHINKTGGGFPPVLIQCLRKEGFFCMSYAFLAGKVICTWNRNYSFPSEQTQG